MAEALRDRLVPSLLDRLTDHNPDSRSEPREARLLSITQLRNCVLRDLSWLFNSIRLEPLEDLAPYPAVRHSTVNYGLPSLSGLTVSGLNLREMERLIRETIAEYEPRLIPDSILVKAVEEARKLDQHNILSFRIEARLWAQPAPVELLLHTDVDLESGQCMVAETRSTTQERPRFGDV